MLGTPNHHDTTTYKTPDNDPINNPTSHKIEQCCNTHALPHDPDLVAVIRAWADLSEPIRKGIVALVRSSVCGDDTMTRPLITCNGSNTSRLIIACQDR